jgi:hypothetical protein
MKSTKIVMKMNKASVSRKANCKIRHSLFSKIQTVTNKGVGISINGSNFIHKLNNVVTFMALQPKHNYV